MVLKSLVDSGASDSFIDSAFVQTQHLPAHNIPPIKLHLIDGTSNSVISQALHLQIHFPTGESQYLTFYVTLLDQSCTIVLGYCWLTRYNPSIDWVLGSIFFWQPLQHESEISPSTETFPSSVPLPNVQNPFPELPKSVPPVTSRKPPTVTLINAATYFHASKLEDSECFQLRISFPEVTGHSTTTSEPPVNMNSVPEDYHEFTDMFSKSKASKLASHRPYDLKIILDEGTTPPFGPIYSLSQEELAALCKFIDENLATGFIQPSRSPHGAPVLLIWKKDGSLRLCVDFRGLNRISKKDRYPLPLISDLLDAPRKAWIYTKIDLRHAYHLIRLSPGDEWKTAFRTCYGSFEWLVMPEGLTNASVAFQQFMNDIFVDMIDVIVIIYLDDILIYSDNITEHKAHIREVLRRLCANRLFSHADKCEFHVTSCEYLGYMLSPEGLTMAPYKVQIIQDWPEPRKVKYVQSFLGFANFYCCFIYGYSKITVPLTCLTCKGTPWHFSNECHSAFEALKKAFTTAPVLTHWILDTQITVETNASDYALTTVLSITTSNGEPHPIAFHSRTFSAPELNYDVHDKELLTIFEAFKRWRHYLEGSGLPIDVVTDHRNSQYFSMTKILTRRQARWSEYLSGFNLVIRFRPGKLGTKPDALTRRWDVYLKEGNSDYASVNPQNYRPVFTSEQLASSLRATTLSIPVLRGSLIMDAERLHSNIRSQLRDDPISAEHLDNQSDPEWTLDPNGSLHPLGRIYVLNSGNL